MSEPLDGNKSIAAPLLFGRNAANSISWSGAEMETHVFKMATKFRDKNMDEMV
jgi:hypothetical protein